MVQKTHIDPELSPGWHRSAKNTWRRTDRLHVTASDSLAFESSEVDIRFESRLFINRKTHFIRRAHTHDARWTSAHVLASDPWISISGEAYSPHRVSRPNASSDILVLKPSQAERADELPKLAAAVLHAMVLDPQAHTISNPHWYLVVPGDEERPYVVIECDTTLSLVDSMPLRGRLNDAREEYELTHGLDDRAGVIVINWS